MKCPELLLMTLAAAREGVPPSAWGALERQLLAMLVPGFLATGSPLSPVISRLWSMHPRALVAAMVDWCSTDSSHTARVLDICQVSAPEVQAQWGCKVLACVNGVGPRNVY
jgi:hypothetical protein